MEIIVSIVTVCYNEETRIKETVESVLQVANSSVEYLIVDGGSTDSTVEIIKSYEGKFKEKNICYRWLSEKDSGIYNAMNKGLDMSRGVYIVNINIGDIINNIPFEELYKNMENQCIAVSFPVYQAIENKVFYPRYNVDLKIHNTIHHQGTFYKKCCVSRYNEEYKIFADFDLNQRILKSKKNIKVFSHPIVASHCTDGISEHNNAAKELFGIIYRNFGMVAYIVSNIFFACRGFVYKVKEIKNSKV